MTLRQHRCFSVGIVTAALCMAAMVAEAQAVRPASVGGPPPDFSVYAPPAPAQVPQRFSTATAPITSAKTAPLVPAETVATHRGSAPSMLDEPAAPAQISISGDRLSINATNSSLSELIRQVASQTGMQVEGNSRDQRVFGVYGPGSPPEVLSALLYDSGYNVVMVGSTADGAPRKLVLSTRTAGAASSGAPATARNNDEEEEEAPQEVQQPPPPPNPGIQAAPPATPGQPRTPQQMLEELQRMHQGQQPPDVPKDSNPN